jgi:flavin-dependent dehydrogenase
MKVAIIGAGLAGTAAAWALRQAGAEPVIYEAGPEIAPGASGNPVGAL